MNIKAISTIGSCVLLASCASMNKPGSSNSSMQSSTTRSGNPATQSYTQDNKGSNVFPLHRPATGNRVFVFDPQSTAWAAYDANGNRVKTGRASGGASWCSDIGRSCKTVTGQFSVKSKGGADCVSSKYPVGEGGAKMPHCMFFHRGYAIHGSYSVPDYNASHGCIRVTPSAAAWLNNNFITPGTTVIVKPY